MKTVYSADADSWLIYKFEGQGRIEITRVGQLEDEPLLRALLGIVRIA